MRIIIFTLLSIATQSLSEQWIDPHDMNTNAKQQLSRLGVVEIDRRRSKNCNLELEENISLIYLKRVINLVINSANLERSGSLEHHGHLHFTINDEDLQFLKSFGSMKNVNIEELRRLDTVLSKSLEQSYSDRISDIFQSAKENIFQWITSQNGLPLLGLVLVLYIAFNLYKSNFSFWYVFRYMILMALLIDFVQRYYQLVEEAEEHNMDLKYSSKCDTSKMTWGQYFKFLAGNEDCERKVVSLLEVGLNQLKNIIIIPLAATGTGMGQFASELWKNLPFPWNFIIFPTMLLFCAVLVVIVTTVKNKVPFKLNIMHLFGMEVGRESSAITGKQLDKFLDAMNHRPLLQEVKSAENKKLTDKSYRKKKGKEEQCQQKENNNSKPQEKQQNDKSDPEENEQKEKSEPHEKEHKNKTEIMENLD